MVAKQAEIPPSSLYHFFPKPEALFNALVQEIFQEFDAIIDQNLDGLSIGHWTDIFTALQNRYVTFYRQHKYVRDLILGQHVINGVHHADFVHDNLLGCGIHKHHDRYYQLPQLPTSHNIFAIALQIADKVYSISHQEHGNITDELAAEGLKASLAYLGMYLPDQMLPTTTSKIPKA